MNYILFDDHTRYGFLPLTYTRPIADLRIGITTIREKWKRHLEAPLSTLTVNSLQDKFPAQIESQNIIIQGGVLPDQSLAEAVQSLSASEALVNDEGQLLAAHLSDKKLNQLTKNDLALASSSVLKECTPTTYDQSLLKLNHWYDLFSNNDKALRTEFEQLTRNRKSAPVPKNTTVLGDAVFVEQGATINCATLNAQEGPIYIGKEAEIMEGSHIRGPCAAGPHSVIKMGAKIYGATTLGPYSKVGGELNNVVIQGYSNKGHDGFLGNAVLGEWCNIGADTNNSNLKNNYGDVKVWNYQEDTFANTGLQFCGLVMGDHSKCAINTMFNTGTTIGVSANIFGGGFPRRFIPSFSWGGSKGFTTFKLSKAYEVAERVMPRRDEQLTNADKEILENVFKTTEKYR
jgi:UDP-N-acetylglucosamine diphosphorylase/glucosamine-1-phosphate N-acetyltransferase